MQPLLLAGWLVGVSGWRVDWLTGWLVGRLARLARSLRSLVVVHAGSHAHEKTGRVVIVVVVKEADEDEEDGGVEVAVQLECGCGS